MSKARLAIMGVLGLSLASCSKAYTIVLFNATNLPLLCDGEVIPAEGYARFPVVDSLEVKNFHGQKAEILREGISSSKRATFGDEVSVVIDEETIFTNALP